MYDLNEIKADYDVSEVDFYFHNSRNDDLDETNFKFRATASAAKASFGKGLGIFTHSGDEYFNKFGAYTYVVVVAKNSGITEREEEGKNNFETFVPANKVLEVARIK
jgi:hypothetical protein